MPAWCRAPTLEPPPPVAIASGSQLRPRRTWDADVNESKRRGIGELVNHGSAAIHHVESPPIGGLDPSSIIMDRSFKRQSTSSPSICQPRSASGLLLFEQLQDLVLLLEQ